MPPRMMYIAYPIDQVTMPEQYRDYYEMLEKAKYAMMDAGVDLVYDPGDAWKLRLGSDIGPEIRAVNMLALQQADCVLAMLPNGLPTIGVPMEIATAEGASIPVAVVTDISVAWALGAHDPDLFQRFDMSAEGFALACAWLSAHPRREEGGDSREPFGFQIVRKAECGKTEMHPPHDFGEHHEESCGGFDDLTPRRAYADDAGWDLIVAEDTVIEPGATADVPMGIAVALPDWAYGRVTGRSSTLRTKGLLVNEGIIDTGYRGELFAMTKNLGPAPVFVMAGDRIAQLIISTNDSRTVRPVEILALPAHPRGERGFGSTGR